MKKTQGGATQPRLPEDVDKTAKYIEDRENEIKILVDKKGLLKKDREFIRSSLESLEKRNLEETNPEESKKIETQINILKQKIQAKNNEISNKNKIFRRFVLQFKIPNK